MENKNNLIFGLVAVIVILIAIGVYYLSTNKKIETPKIIDSSEEVKIKISPFSTEKSETEYLIINTTYPVGSQQKFPELYNFIDGLKREFMNDFDNLTSDDIKFLELGGDRKYDFTVNTKVATSTNTVTYIIEVYRFTGGAHGGTEIGTFTYDVDGKFVPLDSVLQGDYLNTLSTLSRKYFYDILGDVAQNSGTEPKKENFSSWYLTPADIVFIFGQYSVGPYVFGIHEFSIPKSSIKDYISPKFK